MSAVFLIRYCKDPRITVESYAGRQELERLSVTYFVRGLPPTLWLYWEVEVGEEANVGLSQLGCK